MEFNKIRVGKIVEETPDTKSIFFELDNGLKDRYNYVSGQYVTIKAEINGKEVRRSYSICTAAGVEDMAVTVKKVDNGTMSVFLNEQLEVGQELDVSLPEGRFTVEPDHDAERDLYFIAAGSGITPVMSMILTVLEQEPKSTCYLLYGSRSEDNIIFGDQLDAMAKKYDQQLYVVHSLSQPHKEKAAGLSGFFGGKKMSWQGEVGRIDDNKVKDFLGKYPSRSGRSEYFLCGPGGMIESTETFLQKQGVIPENIHKEFFTSKTGAVSLGKQAVVTVTLDRVTHHVEVQKDETILEAMLRNNLDAPYSCTSGACSSCLAKCHNGNIKMDAYYALEDDEVAEGYILTCQSRVLSETAEITYDV